MGIKDGNPTISWGSVLSSTLMHYLNSGSLLNQVHNRSPLLKYLRSGNRIKVLTGGERIRLPVMYEGSGNVKRYGGLEALDVTGYDGVTNAFFDWKQMAAAVVMSGLEKRSNAGENRIRDLGKDRIMQAESELADTAATDAYSDGTANGSKQTTGLAAMIATTNTSGTYADINFGNNDKWRNQLTSGVGNGAVNLLPNLRTVFNDCIEVSGVQGQPDGVFTTQTEAETLEALVVPGIRYTAGGSGELGAEPTYRGAPVKWEAKCQSGTVYVTNSNHLFYFVHRDANYSMNPEGFQRPINQDALIAQILWQGNMGTNLRAALGKLTGIT